MAVNDGGGLARAAPRPTKGATRVARFYAAMARRSCGVPILACTVNGQPGLVARPEGVTVTVFAFDLAGDPIRHVWLVRNPDKLRPWNATSS